MRLFLAIAKRKDSALHDGEIDFRLQKILNNIDALASRAFPVHEGDVKSESWVSPDGNMHLIGWTNEPITADQPLISKSRSHPAAAGRAGYLAGQVRETDFADSPRQLDISTKAGGCFGIFRADERSLQGTTDATRSNGIYYGENDSFRIFSSRALLTHLAIESDSQRTDKPKLKFDLFASRTFASVGYFMGNMTPYLGVEAVEEASNIRIDAWSFMKTHMPIASATSISPHDPEWNKLVDESCEMLIAAYEPASRTTAHLSLTGGRDSRLLAAAMVAHGGIDLRSATTGVEGHPDVDLAKEIARTLNFEHRLHEPIMQDSGSILAEDPMSRIIRNLDVNDASTSAWDDVPTYGKMSMSPSVSGVGGEILRGGMVLQNLDQLTNASAEASVSNTMTGSGNYFHADIMERAKAYAAPWVEPATVDPYGAIDAFYHVHRNGRWVSARRSGARSRAMTVDPLLDNKFIRSVLRISAEARWSERLVYDMIGKMTPQIQNIPIEGARWRFERFRPDPQATANEAETWSERRGIATTSRIAQYSWQQLRDQSIRKSLKSIVADRMDGLAGELLRREVILPLFDDEVPKYPSQLWNVATTCVMLSDTWHETTRPAKTNNIAIEIR